MNTIVYSQDVNHYTESHSCRKYHRELCFIEYLCACDTNISTFSCMARDMDTLIF